MSEYNVAAKLSTLNMTDSPSCASQTLVYVDHESPKQHKIHQRQERQMAMKAMKATRMAVRASCGPPRPSVLCRRPGVGRCNPARMAMRLAMNGGPKPLPKRHKNKGVNVTTIHNHYVNINNQPCNTMENNICQPVYTTQVEQPVSQTSQVTSCKPMCKPKLKLVLKKKNLDEATGSEHTHCNTDCTQIHTISRANDNSNCTSYAKLLEDGEWSPHCTESQKVPTEDVLFAQENYQADDVHRFDERGCNDDGFLDSNNEAMKGKHKKCKGRRHLNKIKKKMSRDKKGISYQDMQDSDDHELSSDSSSTTSEENKDVRERHKKKNRRLRKQLVDEQHTKEVRFQDRDELLGEHEDEVEKEHIEDRCGTQGDKANGSVCQQKLNDKKQRKMMKKIMKKSVITITPK